VLLSSSYTRRSQKSYQGFTFNILGFDTNAYILQLYWGLRFYLSQACVEISVKDCEGRG
jgi:hypothetical protein